MTGIVVSLASNSPSRLSCVGSRCWTNTNAIPVFVGRCLRSWVTASRPPAEAPIPTIGKVPPRGRSLSGCISCVLRVGTGRAWRRDTFRFRFSVVLPGSITFRPGDSCHESYTQRWGSVKSRCGTSGARVGSGPLTPISLLRSLEPAPRSEPNDAFLPDRDPRPRLNRRAVPEKTSDHNQLARTRATVVITHAPGRLARFQGQGPFTGVEVQP